MSEERKELRNQATMEIKKSRNQETSNQGIKEGRVANRLLAISTVNCQSKLSKRAATNDASCLKILYIL